MKSVNLLKIYTLIHVVISLLGILSGFLVIYGMLNADPMNAWTEFFLWTTVLTSVTGFGFPFQRLLPSHVIGLLSLAILAVALYAMYGRRLGGAWKRVYMTCAMLALYFNVFVLVVQSFMKVPALHALAPTQSEAPFAIAQLAVLVIFVTIGILVLRSTRWPAAAANAHG